MITLMMLTFAILMLMAIIFVVVMAIAGVITFMPAVLFIGALVLIDFIFFKIMKAIFTDMK